jgi:hypothetical protein
VLGGRQQEVALGYANSEAGAWATRGYKLSGD